MTHRIALLTEIIAPYRIPVFNVLARREALDLHVIFLAETDQKLRQWHVYKNEICFSHQVLPSWRWRAEKSSFLFNRGLWSALNKLSPQVIICGGYNYAASWEALLWARRHGVAFVLWSESNGRDARAGRTWVEWLKVYFLKHCDGFVVPGKASFEYLKSLGSPEASIQTAPNAVDNRLFAAQAANTRAHAAEFREKLKLPSRFILFVGRLVAEKGVYDLLEAYAKLENDLRSEVSLVFAGDGVCREELAQEGEADHPGRGVFSGIRAAGRSGWSICARGSIGSTDAQRHLGFGGERSDGVRASDYCEQCRGMFGRLSRRWVEWLRSASPRFGETP